MYGKTIQEQREIILEAERRVRAGESRAQVARDLNIPLSTLSGWAHRGGWRRKDLIAVRDAERGREMLEIIAGLTAAEREQQQKTAAKIRKAVETSEAEVAAFASGCRLSGQTGEGPMPAQKLAMAMADSMLRQGRLEDADRAVRLAVRFGEAEQAAGAREETEWRAERERMMKWWTVQQAAYHELHGAAKFVLEEIDASQKLEDSRSADECCPKCGRRMDFWPEEVERPDDDDSGDDDDSSRTTAGDDDDDFRNLMVGDDDFSSQPRE